MAAPTNAANVKKVLANSEPSTHGGKADMTPVGGVAVGTSGAGYRLATLFSSQMSATGSPQVDVIGRRTDVHGRDQKPSIIQRVGRMRGAFRPPYRSP